MVSVYILNVVLGIGLLGFQPFACQAVVERTFPVQEVIPVNFIMVMAQVFGVIGNSVATAGCKIFIFYINIKSLIVVGDNGMWALVVIITPCVIYITFFYRTETKRQQAEIAYDKAKTAENSPVDIKNPVEEQKELKEQVQLEQPDQLAQPEQEVNA